MKMNEQICLILSLSLDFYPFTGVKSVNDCLLDFLIFFVIQCIDFHDLTENLREIFSDFRHRICNNRKTSLITFDIAVCDLAGFIIQFQLLFLLCLCESPALRFAYR